MSYNIIPAGMKFFMKGELIYIDQFVHQAVNMSMPLLDGSETAGFFQPGC